jgi:two-component system sensor histidine kinase YesM
MFRSSIRKRMIILLLLITVIPFSGSILLTYAYTIESLKSKTLEENALLLFQGKTSIQNYLEGLNRLTLSIYKKPESTGWIKSGIAEHDFEEISNLREFLSTMFHFNDDIEQVFLYLSNNEQAFSVSSRYVFNAKNLNYNEQTVLERTDSSEYNTFLQKPHILNHHGLEEGVLHTTDRVITLHRMLVNPSYIPQGILSIDFNTDSIYKLSENIYNPEEERFYLTDPEGNLFFPYTDSEDKEALRYDWFGKLKQQNREQGHFFWESDGFNGVVIYDSLPPSLGGLFLVKQIPFDSLYKDANEIVKMNIAIGLIVLILVVIATLFVSFKITSPIRVLLRNIQRIETGDMEVDFKTLGRDEIGILGSRFKSMIDTIKNMIIREYRLEIQNKTNQLKVLQSQINPHFLNNALQSIGALAVEKDAPEVYKLLRSLSNIMRYSMEMDKGLVPLSREFENVSEYLKLQKERFDERLVVEWQVDDNVRDCIVPKMIIQPLVENYFKHSFENRRNNGRISIQAMLQHSDTLYIAVKDNGIGISEERLSLLHRQLSNENMENEINGIGLVNVYSRLRLYFGDRVIFHVNNAESGGLIVEISLPVVYSESEVRDMSGDLGVRFSESDFDR